IGSWNTTTQPLLGVLRFDAGITGIRLTHNAQMCTIKRLGINSLSYFEEGPYEGHGLHIRGKRWRLEQVFVRGFGEHGIFIEGNALVDSSNANIGNATL